MRFQLWATMALCLTLGPGAQAQPSFEVVLDPKIESGPVDGRILLLLSTRGDDEPRFHVVNRGAPPPFFGLDVEALAPGDGVLFSPITALTRTPSASDASQAPFISHSWPAWGTFRV